MTFPPFRPPGQTRFLFFTGKGGVGKTTVSSACAVALADAGRKVLLISTDPASNLDEVLQTPLGPDPREVRGVPGLRALNIDPMAAAAAYRERVLAPMRGLLPAQVLARMEEELSGACTVEIAAFDAFTGWVAGDGQGYDHVVFDTAPTGHTLRLMGLAKAWDHFLANNTSGTSCLGPLAGLEKQREHYTATVAALSQPERTTLILVARPENSALDEAARVSGELAALGLKNQQLVLNGVFTATAIDDPVARAMETRGLTAVDRHHAFLTSLPVGMISLCPRPVLGIDGLRAFFRPDEAGESEMPDQSPDATLPAGFGSVDTLLDELAAPGRGVIFTMGKGGVGKTTVAAAIATALARRGHRVHLTTTDPANHLGHAIDGTVEGLSVGRIDPEVETAAYREEVIANAGAGLDEAARALLEEDLRSPCTTEIAVFRAFAKAVAAGENGFVVLDTAPTGHTLLLLDASASYQREAERQAREGGLPEVNLLLGRLRDPEFARLLIVTLPEPTPVHEAAALQDDLRRAGIEPFAWVINQCLSMVSTTDPVLRLRQGAEQPCLREVAETLAGQAVCLAWRPACPRGESALLSLLSSPISSPSAHE
jgi:arsenite/tail-anchored protein-transporting ATPase